MRKDIHLDHMNIHWAKDIQKAVYKQTVLCMQDLVSESNNRKQWRNRMVWRQEESQMCNHNLSRSLHQNLNSQMFEWMWMIEVLNYMVEKLRNQCSSRKVSRQDEDCKTMVRMVACLAGDTFVSEWRTVVVAQLVDQMASDKDNLSLEQELCRWVAAGWSKAVEMVEVFPAVFGCYTVVGILEDPTVDELQQERFQILLYRDIADIDNYESCSLILFTFLIK